MSGLPAGSKFVMISVERQLPRNSRIIVPVKSAAMIASRTTPDTAALTKMDWSAIGFTVSDDGNPAWMMGRFFLTRLTTSRVEACPTFNTFISTPRAPSRRTILVSGGWPSRTLATSPMRITAPFAILIGASFRSFRV